ncbi:T9SS type A sorting domain-containing protein [Marinilongibacter aquaticus]|uniref:T9SS type A sorting domain-containing protein n=1 Tax=Marinilongibacter aquaticus TaxID=2975157 RepID=UPI0021BDC739|nr:T9SS type A sorting domain-containing protein [Marinilongibacter aquaticus]UBM59778.1 T9SS type A sorting domain-containing protein [Marinilongibacter aquaticus]
MKRIFPILILSTISVSLFAQNPFQKLRERAKVESKPGTEIICPASHVDENTFIDMPAEVKQALAMKKNLRPSSAEAANIVVEYDSSMPESAKAAFQRAIDIWASLLKSDVQINVAAVWQELGPNVLGSAGPATYYRNFSGAKKRNTWYPVALAEKMAGEDLNTPGDFDIVARFSSEQNWYYGTTGTPAVGQFDFTSVVLHELCHGLGFVGSLTVSGTQGVYGFGGGIPAAFDTYVINEKGQTVTDTNLFQNNTTALRNELISENLFFNADKAKNVNNDVYPRLYAPTVWESGSSVFHLNDKDFPAGTPNSLMTHSAGLREVNYDPGPITLNIMKEMGWRTTSILHNALRDYETATNVEIKARIISDTTLVANTATLNYVILDLATATLTDLENGLANPTKVPMQQVGSTDEYTAILPVSQNNVAVAYFLSVEDSDGYTSISPASYDVSPYLFFVGIPDQWGPVLDYGPPTFVNSGINIPVLTNVYDDYEAGIDTVFVNYAVNGVSAGSFGLRKYNPDTDSDFSQGIQNDNAYLSTEGFPSLSTNDRVTFTITARDAAGNETVIPTTQNSTDQEGTYDVDEYEFAATELLSPVDNYLSDFNSSTEDFAMIGFDINTAEGLADGSLHTSSPYKNGLGLIDPTSGNTFLSFDYNAIAFLRKPISLNADSLTIAFDEIVLVEPGEDGSVFEDADFWDYVAVEVSFDANTWYLADDGYDSGAQSAWKELFNSTLTPSTATNPTSVGVPTVALYRTREIDLSDIFDDSLDGLSIFIRFRLYSDQFVNGWGWSIDNLAIQLPKPQPLASETDPFDLKVSPNPSTDFVDLKAKLAGVDKVELEVMTVSGVNMFQENVDLSNNELSERLDTRSYAPGIYLVKLKSNKGVSTKKFMVLK